MNSSAKKRIAVLRGGPSSEHYFSLESGKHVLDNLDKSKYIPIDIYIDKLGTWHLEGVVQEPFVALRFVDIVFNALHGEYGEDGTVQRLLESINMPYTGADSFVSKIAIDKHTTKLLLANFGINTPRSAVFRPSSKKIDTNLALLWQKLTHPLIVKPVASGSSVGIHVVRDYKTLENKVKKILATGHSALVEEFIVGREISVCVVSNFRNQAHYAAIPVHIKHNKEFFDNISKKTADYILETPNNFSEVEKTLVTTIAKHIHRELGIRYYSRSDFIINQSGIYFLEVNTLPGLTSKSIVPFALLESGISMKEFLSHLISSVEHRHKHNLHM